MFWELFLTVVVLMSTFKNKNSLRTIEAQIVQKLKNNEARPKFTGSYKIFKCLKRNVKHRENLVSCFNYPHFLISKKTL